MVTFKSLESRITAQLFHLTQTNELVPLFTYLVREITLPKLLFFNEKNIYQSSVKYCIFADY